jgi:hypothetical protein
MARGSERHGGGTGRHRPRRRPDGPLFLAAVTTYLTHLPRDRDPDLIRQTLTRISESSQINGFHRPLADLVAHDLAEAMLRMWMPEDDPARWARSCGVVLVFLDFTQTRGWSAPKPNDFIAVVDKAVPPRELR